METSQLHGAASHLSDGQRHCGFVLFTHAHVSDITHHSQHQESSTVSLPQTIQPARLPPLLPLILILLFSSAINENTSGDVHSLRTYSRIKDTDVHSSRPHLLLPLARSLLGTAELAWQSAFSPTLLKHPKLYAVQPSPHTSSSYSPVRPRLPTRCARVQ